MANNWFKQQLVNIRSKLHLQYQTPDRTFKGIEVTLGKGKPVYASTFKWQNENKEYCH